MSAIDISTTEPDSGSGSEPSPNEGAGGARSPMLLLHGFTGTPVMWDPLLPWLERHHEVIALTLPGHYGGPVMPDPGDHIVEAMLDLAEAEMDARGIERAHLVGNSLGGWAALLLANRGRALSTVAIAPAGGWALNSRESRRAVLIFRRMQLSLALTYPLATELVARPRGRVFALWDAVAHPSRLPGPLARQWLRAARYTPARSLLLRYASKVNAPDSLPGADGPIRVAWGTRDRILPYERYSAGWRHALPDADWVMLPGLGHVPMSDDPELVSRTILEFSTAFDARRAGHAA